MKPEFELDDLKSSWSDWNKNLTQQAKVKPMILREVLEQKAQHRLARIIRLEGFGAIFSLLVVVGLFAAWPSADHWTLQLTLAVVQLIMLSSAILGWQLVQRARRVNVIEDSHAVTVEKFAHFKQLLRVYKNFSLGVYALVPFLIPFMAQLFRGSTDPLPTKAYWIIPISIIALAVVWWGFYRFYRRQLSTIRAGIER